MSARPLPSICAARLPATREPILLKYGETGYWPWPSDMAPEKFNRLMGITPAEAWAMFNGSMFGFSVPAADPTNSINAAETAYPWEKEGPL